MIYLLNLIFPPKCVLCAAVLDRAAPPNTPCPSCTETLPLLPQPAVCEGDDNWYIAPLGYQGTVPQGLKALKFRDKLGGVSYFADLMYRAVLSAGLPPFDLVTWVPLSVKRQHKRGYNQAEELGRTLAKRLQLPARHTLWKVRHTLAQSTLNNAGRQQNVAGAYAARGISLQDKRILLVDDIVTTGSTLSECQKVLQAQGAHSVVCVTAARSRTQKLKVWT